MGLTAGDVMQTGVRVVRAELPLPELERRFLEERVSGFPVVDGGRLVGIVSRSDVVRGLCALRSEAEYVSGYYLDLSGFEQSPPEDLAALAARVGERLEHKTVRDVMSGNLITVAPGDPLSEVARTLVEHRIHRLPVTEGEVLVGIVTSLDFARLFADGRVKAL